MKASLFALLALLSAVGTGSREEVTVFAAASLADAVEEIGRAYEKDSGNKVVLNVGASSDLARQILAGAGADLFFSADRAQMDVVEKAGLVRGSDRVELLSNVLVVVVPVDAPTRVGSPADLALLRRIALADPEAVPAGVYARRYLESIGLWSALKDRVIPTDAALSRRVRVAFTVPAERGPRIVYVLAPLAASRKPATLELVRRLAGPEARTIFERYGFQVLAPR